MRETGLAGLRSSGGLVMGVREIDRSLDQWQMGVKDFASADDSGAHTQGAGSGGTPSGSWRRAGQQRPTAEALERDPPHHRTVGFRFFGEGGPAALIFEQTGGSPPSLTRRSRRS